MYIRVAERREPRPERSQLGEAVEMVVLGVVLSSASAMVAIGLAREVDLLDIDGLLADVPAYLAHHPFRGFGTLLIVLALSYGGALGAAYLRHRKQQSVIRPGGTMWHDVFWRDRPTTGHSTILTVGLRDGRKVTGMLRGFTAEFEDSREIALVAPLAFQRSAGDTPRPLDDRFILFREEDVLYAAGRYWPTESEAPGRDDA